MIIGFVLLLGAAILFVIWILTALQSLPFLYGTIVLLAVGLVALLDDARRSNRRFLPDPNPRQSAFGQPFIPPSQPPTSYYDRIYRVPVANSPPWTQNPYSQPPPVATPVPQPTPISNPSTIDETMAQLLKIQTNAEAQIGAAIQDIETQERALAERKAHYDSYLLAMSGLVPEPPPPDNKAMPSKKR